MSIFPLTFPSVSTLIDELDAVEDVEVSGFGLLAAVQDFVELGFDTGHAPNRADTLDFTRRRPVAGLGRRVAQLLDVGRGKLRLVDG